MLIFIDAIRGQDPKDPTSFSNVMRQRCIHNHDTGALRIGIPLEYNILELDPVVRATWLKTLKSLQKHGHTIHQVSLPHTKLALSAYYIIALAEASSNLAKFDGLRYGQQAIGGLAANGVLYAATRGKGFGEEVKRRILLGAYSLSASAMDNYFLQAQRVRRLVRSDFNKVFALPNPLLKRLSPDMSHNQEGVHVLITPTTTSMAPQLSAVANKSPVERYRDDVLTVPASLAGLPAMSVPIQTEGSADLPSNQLDTVGIQLIAQYGDDAMVFKVAQLLEDMA